MGADNQAQVYVKKRVEEGLVGSDKIKRGV